MACGGQKSAARDEVECRHILFFARTDVFFDFITDRSTKIKSVCFMKQKGLNKRGKTPRKHFAEE